MSLANKQFMVTITYMEDAKSNFVHLTQIICYPYPIWIRLDPKKKSTNEVFTILIHIFYYLLK
jgi:hypothetical protein